MQADLRAPTCNTENPHPSGLLVKWKKITYALIACGHAVELYQELNIRTSPEDAASGHASRLAYQYHEESCRGPAISNGSQLIANSAENNRSIYEFASGDEDIVASSLDESDIDNDIYNDLVVPSYLIDEAADLSQRNYATNDLTNCEYILSTSKLQSALLLLDLWPI